MTRRVMPPPQPLGRQGIFERKGSTPLKEPLGSAVRLGGVVAFLGLSTS